MLQTHDHRPSVQLKHSFCSEAGSICQPKVSVAGRMSEQFQAPPKTRIISTGGQVFLCVLGSVISVSICIWLAIFSSDLPWRRMLFSGGAALCALMFGMLAFTSMRRVVNPAPEPIPNLAQRRSTIQKLRKNTATHVVIDSTDHECTSGGSGDHHQHASLIATSVKKTSMNA